jgi:hypothetical protein
MPPQIAISLCFLARTLQCRLRPGVSWNFIKLLPSDLREAVGIGHDRAPRMGGSFPGSAGVPGVSGRTPAAKPDRHLLGPNRRKWPKTIGVAQ